MAEPPVGFYGLPKVNDFMAPPSLGGNIKSLASHSAIVLLRGR